MIGKFMLNMQDKSFNNKWGVKEDPLFDKLNKVTVSRLSQIDTNYAKTDFLRFNAEKILELARPFTNVKEMIDFKGENKIEINAAGRYINEKVVQRPEWFIDVIINKYSKDIVKKLLAERKYKSRGELRDNNQPLYKAASRYKLLDKYFPKYKKRKLKYSNEDLANIALQFETPIEFRKANGGAYNTAYDRGILGEICAHMTSKFKK